MNRLIQERHNHSASCFMVKVFRRTQTVVSYLANETFDLAFFSTDVGHIFASIVGIEPDWCWEEKDLTNQKLLASLSAYTLPWNLQIWFSTILFSDTKAPLLHYFSLISNLKAGNVITTRQYMNYQTFNKLQFRPLPNSSFHSIHIDLTETSGGKTLCIFLFLMFRKASNIHL